MISKKLAQNFSFVSDYFTLLLDLNPKKFPQSIVFEGLNPYAQCFFALELARVLNCLQDASENCNCLNCRWIRENKHPAVNFVSQLHYKGVSDDSKTVISVPQVKDIEKSLREKSDYHRFFIFFDAKPIPLNECALSSIERYSPVGYNIFPDSSWTLGHINAKTFSPLTPNILLKCVEEPPQGTTFVFLTKNRADLINTIVSRSQCFKLPFVAKKLELCDIKEIFHKYPNINFEDAFLISDKLQNYVKDNEITADFLLDLILAYFVNELQISNEDNYISKLQNDINLLSEARKYLNASISQKNVFDTLLLKIARGAK